MMTALETVDTMNTLNKTVETGASSRTSEEKRTFVTAESTQDDFLRTMDDPDLGRTPEERKLQVFDINFLQEAWLVLTQSFRMLSLSESLTGICFPL